MARKFVAAIADDVPKEELVARLESLRAANRRQDTEGQMNPYWDAPAWEIGIRTTFILNELKQYSDPDLGSLKRTVKGRARVKGATEALTFLLGVLLAPLIYFAGFFDGFHPLIASLGLGLTALSWMILPRQHKQVSKLIQLRRELVSWSEAFHRQCVQAPREPSDRRHRRRWSGVSIMAPLVAPRTNTATVYAPESSAF